MNDRPTEPEPRDEEPGEREWSVRVTPRDLGSPFEDGGRRDLLPVADPDTGRLRQDR